MMAGETDINSFWLSWWLFARIIDPYQLRLKQDAFSLMLEQYIIAGHQRARDFFLSGELRWAGV